MFLIVLIYWIIIFVKKSLNKSESYIDSSKWLKSKKSTINPKNNDDKCFQYALVVALNYEQIKTGIHKKYKKLSLLLINIIGKR